MIEIKWFRATPSIKNWVKPYKRATWSAFSVSTICVMPKTRLIVVDLKSNNFGALEKHRRGEDFFSSKKFPLIRWILRFKTTSEAFFSDRELSFHRSSRKAQYHWHYRRNHSDWRSRSTNDMHIYGWQSTGWFEMVQRRWRINQCCHCQRWRWRLFQEWLNYYHKQVRNFLLSSKSFMQCLIFDDK